MAGKRKAFERPQPGEGSARRSCNQCHCPCEGHAREKATPMCKRLSSAQAGPAEGAATAKDGLPCGKSFFNPAAKDRAQRRPNRAHRR